MLKGEESAELGGRRLCAQALRLEGCQWITDRNHVNCQPENQVYEFENLGACACLMNAMTTIRIMREWIWYPGYLRRRQSHKTRISAA